MLYGSINNLEIDAMTNNKIELEKDPEAILESIQYKKGQSLLCIKDYYFRGQQCFTEGEYYSVYYIRANGDIVFFDDFNDEHMMFARSMNTYFQESDPDPEVTLENHKRI